MRIVVKNDIVTGYVDYNGSGHETDVIRVSIEDGTLQVRSSMSLPVRHKPALLTLACFNEVVIKAQSMMLDAKSNDPN